jgi:septal ring factor EnvC (AmiA/AmiB activator)
VTATKRSLLERDRRPFPIAPSRDPLPSRRGRWIAGLAVAALLAAALGYLVDDQVRAHDQLDRARSSLGVTQHRTKTTSAELADLRRDLDLLAKQVGSDATALNQDGSQLKGAQAALAAAQANVSQQDTRITSLRTCLGGVERALNALSVGKQGRAVAALESVAASCSSAAAFSG